MKNWSSLRILGLMILLLSAFAGAACDPNQGVSSAMCAFIVGDGSVNHDQSYKYTLYPGQTAYVGEGQTVQGYYPCNNRDYIITLTKSSNASGKTKGDSSDPVTALTRDGVAINVGINAQWTINESKQAQKEFYPLCFKFTCFSDTDAGGTANFATDGWNGMLGETMDYAIRDTVKATAAAYDDTTLVNRWLPSFTSPLTGRRYTEHKDQNDPTQMDQVDTWQVFADDVAALFADNARAYTRSYEDIFCGSGVTSGWSNPSQPGQGTYNCGPVGFKINDIEKDNTRASSDPQAVKRQNAQDFENAIARYGNAELAGEALKDQDNIKTCAASGASMCVAPVGGSNGTSIAVSAPHPTPPASATAVPTATKK